MSEKLLTIHDSFIAPDKGTVIVGRSSENAVAFAAGNRFFLVSPDGRRQLLTALAVEPFTKCFNEATQLGILVGNQIKPEDAPNESEVWSA